MIDDQIKEFFADSDDGGRPQSRWNGVVVQSPEPINQKATGAFRQPINKHQMEQLRKDSASEKTKVQRKWGLLLMILKLL